MLAASPSLSGTAGSLPIPESAERPLHWPRLAGAGEGLALAALADAPTVIVAADNRRLQQLRDELAFFLGDAGGAILHLPDWECLPYDVFSPHQDIISERLKVLSRLPALESGIVLVTAANLMQRLPPRAWVLGQAFAIRRGDRVDVDALRQRLQEAAYLSVSQVMAPGEFAVRGGIVDIFPMGVEHPFRLDLFGDTIESIRWFDPETQRSRDSTGAVALLPAREFPMTEEGITTFRRSFRREFEGDPQRQLVYTEVSAGRMPAGIEFFLPLFFDSLSTLFDYVDLRVRWVLDRDAADSISRFHAEIRDRHANANLDPERRVLPPQRLFLEPAEVEQGLADRPRLYLGGGEAAAPLTAAPPDLAVDPGSREPYRALFGFLGTTAHRVLLVAETIGRREALEGLLAEHGLKARAAASWRDFLDRADVRLGITVATLERGLVLPETSVSVVTESQLYGERVYQRRRRGRRVRDPESVIRSLVELNEGDPVVHEDHGVGRYRGLTTLTIDGQPEELLTLEYQHGDKLYVPVLSLHLVSRYVGGDPDHAPLHRLGSDAWDKARRRAREKAYDVAAELLEVEALRGAREGFAFEVPVEEYDAFCSRFPFEETPDQLQVIDEVIADLRNARPMDRLVCGDVGFGKTEIAMRAAFIAVHNGRQVAVLVPTTLLAQQHYETFRDRFAGLPIQVDLLSRFRSRKEIGALLSSLERGYPDIVIGTHRLLQADVRFRNLGLLIIDEEHRFGVRQKERLKNLRSEVDILTLTATPIPRTLNLAMADLRTISIIATPPRERLSIKTFVRPWNHGLIREACLREIHRGGQVYFLHNEIRTIDRTAAIVAALVPEARVRVGHGQMPESELERLMQDFYHQRFNILVCTSIVESGIDVPTANTIIINRADRFGMAQLHQLRGRVGRSHHQAYAYLLVPEGQAISADAGKRLEAITQLEDLGAGFALASYDLEIRGAGELLGEAQSGSIDDIGFTLYADMLNRAIRDIRRHGGPPDGGAPATDTGDGGKPAEVNIHAPALFPADYLPDVHTRLVMYKRITEAATTDELWDLQVEAVDRFGLLPAPGKRLFRVAALRLKAMPLRVRRIDFGPSGGRIEFHDSTTVDPARIIELVRREPRRYRLDGGSALRVRVEIADPEERLGYVEALLERLA